MTANGAASAADQARDHEVLDWGARMGFAVYGVLYVVLAWLAAQLAVGGHSGRSGSVSRQGALHQLARQPLGGVLLWVAFAGFCALVVWEIAAAIGGHRDRDGAQLVLTRANSAFKAIVFAGFAFSTAKVALGSGHSKGTDGWTARLMRQPAGPAIVGAVGVAIIGYGVFSVVKGLRDKWRRELTVEGRTGDLGRAITVLARAGYTARGVAFAIIGGLFLWAAITHDPKHSGGLDRALDRLRGAPFGTVLLLLVAIGLACYGVFNVAKARHLRSA